VIGDDALIVALAYDGDGRRATITATGARSAAFLAAVDSDLGDRR